MAADSLRRRSPHRVLGPNHDGVGLAGEEAFAARYGYPVDRQKWARGGDGGADFRTHLGTLDVKTYRRPRHLLVEAEHVRANAYVLAHYDDLTERAELLAWATRAEILAASIADVGGMGVHSHALAATALRSLAALDRLLGAWCPGCGAGGLKGPDLDRRRLRGGPRPSDFVAICELCRAVGWRLIEEVNHG